MIAINRGVENAIIIIVINKNIYFLPLVVNSPKHIQKTIFFFSSHNDLLQYLISTTIGMAEDRGMQTMSSTTSVKNDAFNECCQEEIQPREEYAETHIKEVNMPHYEFYMQKHIPEV